jgi:hypothetical protein
VFKKVNIMTNVVRVILKKKFEKYACSALEYTSALCLIPYVNAFFAKCISDLTEQGSLNSELRTKFRIGRSIRQLNRVLMRIFGPKRDEVTGKWRKLHNKELRDLCSSPNIIRIIKLRRMRWAGHVVRIDEKRNAYRLCVGKPEGKGTLGRPRRRWVDNVKMDLGEVGWGDVDWIGLAQDRNRWRGLVNSVLNLRVP